MVERRRHTITKIADFVFQAVELEAGKMPRHPAGRALIGTWYLRQQVYNAKQLARETLGDLWEEPQGFRGREYSLAQIDAILVGLEFLAEIHPNVANIPVNRPILDRARRLIQGEKPTAPPENS